MCTALCFLPPRFMDSPSESDVAADAAPDHTMMSQSRPVAAQELTVTDTTSVGDYLSVSCHSGAGATARARRPDSVHYASPCRDDSNSVRVRSSVVTVESGTQAQVRNLRRDTVAVTALV